MPEGDTIVRIAKALRRTLEGGRITGFESPLVTLRDAALVGVTIEQVSAGAGTSK